MMSAWGGGWGAGDAIRCSNARLLMPLSFDFPGPGGRARVLHDIRRRRQDPLILRLRRKHRRHGLRVRCLEYPGRKHNVI